MRVYRLSSHNSISGFRGQGVEKLGEGVAVGKAKKKHIQRRLLILRRFLNLRGVSQ